jgi:hypothetical protein
MFSQEQSRSVGHNDIRTEQILIGLLMKGLSMALKVLCKEGFKLKDTRMEVELIISRESSFVFVEILFIQG